MRHKTAILGFGRMGQKHVQKVHDHPKFELIAIAEPKTSLRKKFNDDYNLPAYSSVNSLITNEKPEVVIVSTPTSSHSLDCINLLKKMPTLKLLVCEKPFTSTIEEGMQVHHMAIKKNVPILINYSRRFKPSTMKMRTLLKEKAWGETQKIITHYTRGLKCNGSHFIDYILHTIGEPNKITVLNPGQKYPDNDADPDLLFEYDSGLKAYFISHNTGKYTITEINFYTENALISSSTRCNSVKIFPATSSTLHTGYTLLSTSSIDIPDQADSELTGMLDEIHANLIEKTALSSTSTTALNTLLLIEKIFQKREELCRTQ